jgi:hypothetical protein
MTQISPSNRPDCGNIIKGKSLWTLERDDIKREKIDLQKVILNEKSVVNYIFSVRNQEKDENEKRESANSSTDTDNEYTEDLEETNF